MVPTLILGADQDTLTPLWCSRALYQQIPGARLQTVYRAGHMLMLEKPQAVAAALAAFFSSLPDRPADQG
jgi:pimeloyl-ACP methyl ester carboxylesterase